MTACSTCRAQDLQELGQSIVFLLSDVGRNFDGEVLSGGLNNVNLSLEGKQQWR